MEIHIHPLVLINMSDHWTRAHAQGQTESIVGALIGTQEGRKVDIHNSFELLRDREGRKILCDEYFETRKNQYLEVFPQYEILGWYSHKTNRESTLDSKDAALRAQFLQLSQNDNPLLVLLEASSPNREELPVTLYDSVVKIGTDEVVWTSLPYSIDTSDAERIAVDHVAKRAITASNSDFIQHVSSLRNSVLMLDKRILGLLEYLENVKGGNLPRNHIVLRQLLSICNSLQASWEHQGIRAELEAEHKDALLCVYCASLTQICAQLGDIQLHANMCGRRRK